MSETKENCVTDSNVVPEQVTVVNDDVPSQFEEQREKVNYEVVFFARYHTSLRPPAEDVTAYFNQYGTVHHVNCPKDSNYAFVFMSSLNTTAERRRTRTTISKIIQDMTPENKFHITVASSNRGAYDQDYNRPRQQQYGQYNNRNYGSYPGNDNRGYGKGYDYNRYDGQQYQRRPYMRNANQNDMYDSSRPARMPGQPNGFGDNYDQNRPARRPYTNGPGGNYDQNRPPRRQYTQNGPPRRPYTQNGPSDTYDQNRSTARRPYTSNNPNTSNGPNTSNRSYYKPRGSYQMNDSGSDQSGRRQFEQNTKPQSAPRPSAE